MHQDFLMGWGSWIQFEGGGYFGHYFLIIRVFLLIHRPADLIQGVVVYYCIILLLLGGGGAINHTWGLFNHIGNTFGGGGGCGVGVQGVGP